MKNKEDMFKCECETNDIYGYNQRATVNATTHCQYENEKRTRTRINMKKKK